MVHRNLAVKAAAIAALTLCGVVRAQSTPQSSLPDDGLSIKPLLLQAAPATGPTTTPATAPAPTPTPLMLFLGTTPVGAQLDGAGIHVGGFIEGGYTAGSKHVPTMAGRVFDTKNEHVVLDQADFAISRAVDYGAAATNKKIDIGATFEVVYGWDSGLIHSNGLYDNSNSPRKSSAGAYYASRISPENQFDINQAFIDFALPVGSGLRIRVGKEVTPIGFEVINASQNLFYSHSYLFGYAIPFTNTGIFAEYKISPEWQLDGGVSRGWNQSLLDNNGSPDSMFSFTYTPQGSPELQKYSFILNTEVGPELAGDNHDWWSLFDVIVNYKASDALTLTINADFGNAPHAIPGTSATWYGAAGYASYVVNPMFTVNFRGEWYQDVHGFTLAAPGTINVYEATLGVKITPLPDDKVLSNLAIRPEIRYDYGDKRYFNGDLSQFSFGIDIYFVY